VKQPSLDLRELRTRADRARLKGKSRKAIRLYRKILGSAPEDAATHRKLAPLLARRGQAEESWRSYQVACGSLMTRGFDAKAAGLLREAVTLDPRNANAWKRLAEIEESLGRTADAHNTLLEAHRHFTGSRNRGEAIALLSAAHRLDPADMHTGFELARLLRRAGNPQRAQKVLHGLLQRFPNQRRLIRRALFRTRPTLHAFWAWIRCPRESGWSGPGELRASSR
jgi:tetratricopeptide (TPR) repeat protein